MYCQLSRRVLVVTVWLSLLMSACNRRLLSKQGIGIANAFSQ